MLKLHRYRIFFFTFLFSPSNLFFFCPQDAHFKRLIEKIITKLQLTIKVAFCISISLVECRNESQKKKTIFPTNANIIYEQRLILINFFFSLIESIFLKERHNCKIKFIFLKQKQQTLILRDSKNIINITKNADKSR